MKRNLILSISIVVLVSVLALKEWLVSQEVSAIQQQLKSQISQSLDSADSLQRVQELSQSTYVYDHFITPVFEAANKHLWPSSRQNILETWVQELHAEISLKTDRKATAFKGQLETELLKIREGNQPSVDRLVQILKKSQSLSPTTDSAEIVQSEMLALKEFGQQRDAKMLNSVKEEGLLRLKALRKLLAKADQKKMGELLSSGRFVQEIQQPAIELILQIRQEEVRRTAWKEFRTKLHEILSRRSAALANITKVKRQKEIEKLFMEEPVAHLNYEEESRVLPDSMMAPAPSNSKLPAPPSRVPAASERELYNEGELASPSDANSFGN